jgi:CRP-like cAMP-binding protein/RimJ/RimL family protein N-acetyltransferase
VKDIQETTTRLANDTDVDAVKDLFVAAYGHDYPFREFYDTSWLKAAVFDEDTIFLVVNGDEHISGTVSVMLTAGNLSDLIGEFGRLVVQPNARRKRLATRLLESAIDRVAGVIQFGFAEAVTFNIASQRIMEHLGFSPIGFEPKKYKLEDRESVVMYGRSFGHAPDLRRNHPRLIPEAAPLAMSTLERMGFVQDVVVVEDDVGYPSLEKPADLQVDDLSEEGWSPLLRIERGRVRGREIFGNLSLSLGLLKIKTKSTRYLMARRDGVVVGGLGFTHDPVDQKVRIFELIGFDGWVKGTLLSRAVQIATEELKVVYIEADVNAYTPEIQRTLERMGFLAVAYCPSMVFEEVERLDVIRMAKLNVDYYSDEIALTESAAKVRDIVECSMADRQKGSVVAAVARNAALLRGLTEGDVYHLARFGHIRKVVRDEYVIRRGEAGDRLYISLSGQLRVSIGDIELGTIEPGATFGEIAVVDGRPRTADVVVLQPGEVIEIYRSDLRKLMEKRPRLGAVIMRNLAIDLGEKLRNVHRLLAESYGCQASSDSADSTLKSP